AVPPTFVQIRDRNFGDVVKEKLASYGQEWSEVKVEDAQDGLYNAEKPHNLRQISPQTASNDHVF
ncbi:MAG: hypothetical protein ACFN4W_07275, partial [Segatella oris]